MQDLKPNEQRSQNAILLIWIALAMNCISLVSSYFQYDLLQTAANGGEISAEDITSNDNREQAIGIIQLKIKSQRRSQVRKKLQLKIFFKPYFKNITADFKSEK